MVRSGAPGQSALADDPVAISVTPGGEVDTLQHASVDSLQRAILEASEQLGRRLALDDPVADLRQAVRVRNTGKRGGQPLARSCVELPRRLPAQQRTLTLLDPLLDSLLDPLLAALLAALLTTLLDPLCGPLLNGFGQHRPHLLKPRQRPGHRPAESPGQQHLRHPFGERRRQLRIILLPKQIDQRPQQL